MAVEAAAAGAPDRSKAIGIAIWTAILLLGAGIALAVSWVRAYQPLESGTMSGISRQSKEIDTFGDIPVEVLTPWEEGATFFAGFTMRNDGPRTVTVEGLLEPYELAKDGDSPNGFQPIAVALAPRERFVGDLTLDFEDYDEFVPFELGPGEERRVAIEYLLGTCVPRNQSMSDDSVTVRFSVFGMDREAKFDLPYRLAADGRLRRGC